MAKDRERHKNNANLSRYDVAYQNDPAEEKRSDPF